MAFKEKKNWSLNILLYCARCKVECITTEKGVICPKCGDFITDIETDQHHFSRKI